MCFKVSFTEYDVVACFYWSKKINLIDNFALLVFYIRRDGVHFLTNIAPSSSLSSHFLSFASYLASNKNVKELGKENQ